jgi:hypothetical protein
VELLRSPVRARERVGRGSALGGSVGTRPRALTPGGHGSSGWAQCPCSRARPRGGDGQRPRQRQDRSALVHPSQHTALIHFPKSTASGLVGDTTVATSPGGRGPLDASTGASYCYCANRRWRSQLLTTAVVSRQAAVTCKLPSSMCGWLAAGNE